MPPRPTSRIHSHKITRPGHYYVIYDIPAVPLIRQQAGDHVVCDTVLVTDDGCELLTTTARGEARSGG
jgi:hypothetical protein